MQNKSDTTLVPLSELIVSINSGLNPRNNFKLNEEGATCFYLNVKNIKSDNSGMDFDTISKQAMEMIQKKCNLEKGDILIPAILTHSHTAMVIGDGPLNIGISENVYAIKPAKCIKSQYLCYVIQTEFVQKQIKEKANGKPLARITKKMLHEIMIPVVDNSRQEYIVKILDELNDANMLMVMSQVKLKYMLENFIYNNSEAGPSISLYDVDIENNVEKATKNARTLYNSISKMQNAIIKHSVNYKRRGENK